MVPLAWAMAAITVVLWSLSYPWAKSILTWLDPILTAQARFGIAALVILLVTLPGGRLWPTFRSNWKAYLAIGILGFTIYQLLLMSGLTLTTAMNSAVIMALAPVLTMLGAALFLKEPLTRRHVVGLSISVVGAALAVLGDSPRGLAGFTLDAGEPMVFVAAFCLAFYTIASKRFLSTEVSPVLNIAVLLIVGALCLAPFALFARFPTTPPSLEVLGSIAGISIGSTLIGYLFWLRAGQVLGVDRPNRLFNFIPVLTMIITWIAGVAPYPEQIIGAVLVVAGVTVASIGSKSSHHPPGHT